VTEPPENVPEELSRTIETLYRSESGRILATLVRLLGDLDVAEEAMHEAFAAAFDTWPQAGVPDKPRPWLISTARFKAINGMRRRARFDSAQKDLALYLEARIKKAPQEDEDIEDDRLRLIFTCCHPALPSKGQVALTLREVCGLTTEEIARAFLVPPATLAQRIVRAKAVIREKAIPYQVRPPMAPMRKPRNSSAAFNSLRRETSITPFSLSRNFQASSMDLDRLRYGRLWIWTR
jgi:RNA polymerase sigma-70 factor (ECF subfamily)